ncbi:MAG: hypothetical protein Q8R92_19440 [Deltaproteobacteria bacterium]|nr:hypothetical protein [Deltaproteobacteria bacterium]
MKHRIGPLILIATALLAPALEWRPALAEPATEDLAQRVKELESRLKDLETNRRLEGDLQRFDALTGRLDDLEVAVQESSTGVPRWVRDLRISGGANLGYFEGGDNSWFPDGSFQVWDSRLFVEGDLGRDISFGEKRVIRDISFLFEWDLVRLGELSNQVGELYVDFHGVFDTDWVNLQFGRFQIPVGENYLRFGQGYRDNPFISNTVGGPWWWDEGLKVYGAGYNGKLGYVASVTNGETPFNSSRDENKQLTLKLFTNPTRWLHLSASALRSGKLGSNSVPGLASLWLGESFPRAFGSGTGVPNFDHGVAVPDGPFQLENVSLYGADAILSFEDKVRLWLAYGIVGVDSEGPDIYDRNLSYWIAELILQGRLASPALTPLYLGVRANGYGTYDDNEGYLLDLNRAGTLGYNMKSLNAYSLVLGWHLTEKTTLKAEYTIQDIDLVRGVAPAMTSAAGRANYFAFELGFFF